MTGLSEADQARILGLRAWRAATTPSGAAEARRLAQEAQQLDARCAEAYMALAELVYATGGAPTDQLQHAVDGRTPLPEALGWLATFLPAGDRRCELRRRYLAAAPRGRDAAEVRGLRCP